MQNDRTKNCQGTKGVLFILPELFNYQILPLPYKTTEAS